MKKVISFIAGLFIFCFLPAASWGVNDLHGFFLSAPRMIYVIMMAILSLLVVIFVPEEGRSRGKGIKPAKKHNLSLFFLQIVAPLIVASAPWFDRHGFVVMPDNLVIRLCGVIAVCTGFLLMNWSVVALGPQFSTDVTIQENHRLVTGGPYRMVRHPRYLGILIFFSGISMVFRSWISMILVVALVILHVWRIHDEEKLMYEKFGNEWEEYRKKTKSLIPFLY